MATESTDVARSRLLRGPWFAANVDQRSTVVILGVVMC